MYNGLQPLISQLDEKPTRRQILTQLGTIELALQAEHPAMLYSDILTHAYDRLAQNLKGGSRLPWNPSARYLTPNQSKPQKRNARHLASPSKTGRFSLIPATPSRCFRSTTSSSSSPTSIEPPSRSRGRNSRRANSRSTRFAPHRTSDRTNQTLPTLSTF